jgi:putative RecB family exonuclease
MASREVTYSYSRIASFDKCPRAYRYRYLDKIPEAFTSVEAHMGRAVHGALAWLYETRESDAEPTLPDLLGKFDEEWTAGLTPRVKLIRRDDSFEARRGLGREMLAGHHAGPFREDRLTTVATEQDLRTRLDGAYNFRGIVDRLAEDGNGELHLIDYKTTGRPPLTLDDETALQLRSYGMLVLEHHGGRRARLTYQYLKNQSELGETFEEYQAPDLARNLARRIERTESADEFPARPSGLCAWCGYREICDVSGHYAGAGAAAAAGGDPAAPGEATGCPRCGGTLRLRNGKFGAFLGCANYPRCRYTRDA